MVCEQGPSRASGSYSGNLKEARLRGLRESQAVTRARETSPVTAGSFLLTDNLRLQ